MKKKTITLITSNIKTYSVQRILEECKKLGHQGQTIETRNLVTDGSFNYLPDLVINRATSLNFDDLDLSLLSYFESRKVECRNPLHSFELLRNKERQLMELGHLNIRTPPSLHLRGALDEKKIEQIKAVITKWQKLKIVEKKYNDHFVLKTMRGNKGIGVNLVRGFDSLTSLLETFWALGDQRIILQPYLQHRKEYRLFFIKSGHSYLIEKTNGEDDFRSNANRSKTKWIKRIPKNLQPINEITETVCQHFNLHYAGLDFWQAANGEFILGEVNPVPGFENIEALTGENIARVLLE